MSRSILPTWSLHATVVVHTYESKRVLSDHLLTLTLHRKEKKNYKKANRRLLWLVPRTSTIVARNGDANDFQILDFQAHISQSNALLGIELLLAVGPSVRNAAFYHFPQNP